MRITKIKLYFVPVRFLYLKIETDEGVSGWGEPIVEGRASTVAAAVREFSDMLIGKNPLAIEHLWQTMYRGAFYRGGPVLMSAISGIDQALWDIKGKVLGVPVYELLGGAVKERVKVYRGIGGANEKALADDALLAREQGYRLVKFCPADATHYVDSIQSVDKAVARVAAVREAVGNTVDIAVDFHGRVHKPMAKPLVDALRPYRLAFIEEAVLPTNNEVLSHLAHHTASPLATGERMYSRWDYKPLLESGAADILQPDLSHAGGISECRRIAAMAEAYDVAVAPHCPLSVIAFAACIQLDACTANAVFQEQSIGIHNCTRENPSMQWITNPEVFAFSDGYVSLPKGPGLGIEPDEARIAAANETPHNWKNPLLWTDDGTPIEW